MKKNPNEMHLLYWTQLSITIANLWNIIHLTLLLFGRFQQGAEILMGSIDQNWPECIRFHCLNFSLVCALLIFNSRTNPMVFGYFSGFVLQRWSFDLVFRYCSYFTSEKSKRIEVTFYWKFGNVQTEQNSLVTTITLFIVNVFVYLCVCVFI